MVTRVEGLDIDNPLYNYTENCNRYDEMHPIKVGNSSCFMFPIPLTGLRR